MKSGKALLLVLSVLLFVIAATAADAPTLTFKFTTVRVPGALNTSVEGINNAGVIAGQYQAGKGITRGFVRDGNKLTRIDHPNGSNTVCRNINSSGVIVGNYADSSATIRGGCIRAAALRTSPVPQERHPQQPTGSTITGWLSALTATPRGWCTDSC
jgi:hypothetical protein